MRYLLTLYSEEGGREDATPEQMQAVMDRWFAYTQEARDSGAFVAGEGLQEGATATTVRIEQGSEPGVTDGPFAETKEQLGGFYLLECKDLDEAIERAKRIPLQKGAIEVRPVMVFDDPGAEQGQAQEAARS